MKNKSKNIPNLVHFIGGLNSWAELSKSSDLININNLTDTDAKEIFASVDNELSPENLYCDGEISDAQAEAKRKYFVAVEKELLGLGFQHI